MHFDGAERAGRGPIATIGSMIDPDGPDELERARALHARSIVIDTHCDTTARLGEAGWDFAKRHADGHLDLPRLREGGVSTVFLAVFAPGPVEPGAGIAAAKRQLDLIHALVQSHPDETPEQRNAKTNAELNVASVFSALVQAKSLLQIATAIKDGTPVAEELVNMLRSLKG